MAMRGRTYTRRVTWWVRVKVSHAKRKGKGHREREDN